MTAAVSEKRVLQPSAWGRAAFALIFSTILLAVMLHVPVGLLFPEETRPLLPVIAIIVVTLGSIGGGLARAYPRVWVDAQGALHVRGRTIAPQEITGATRAIARGRANTFTYRLHTASGFRVRILAAHTTLRTLSHPQLAVLREVIEASSIPHSAASLAEVIAADALASGHYAAVDKQMLLDELDSVLNPSTTAEGYTAVAADGTVAEVKRPTPEQVEALLAQIEADDATATADLATRTPFFRIARAIGGWLAGLIAIAIAGLLIVILVIEGGGHDFGSAAEEPLVMAMVLLLAGFAVAYVVWSVLADLHDTQLRRAGRAWLASASEEQLRRGLPAPYARGWKTGPGGRTVTIGVIVLGCIALLAVIAGPITMGDHSNIPLYASWGILVAGVVLSVATFIWWTHVRHLTRASTVWLVGAMGQRVTGPEVDGPEEARSETEAANGAKPSAASGSVDAGR